MIRFQFDIWLTASDNCFGPNLRWREWVQFIAVHAVIMYLNHANNLDISSDNQSDLIFA